MINHLRARTLIHKHIHLAGAHDIQHSINVREEERERESVIVGLRGDGGREGEGGGEGTVSRRCLI